MVTDQGSSINQFRYKTYTSPVMVQDNATKLETNTDKKSRSFHKIRVIRRDNKRKIPKVTGN